LKGSFKWKRGIACKKKKKKTFTLKRKKRRLRLCATKEEKKEFKGAEKGRTNHQLNFQLKITTTIRQWKGDLGNCNSLKNVNK